MATEAEKRRCLQFSREDDFAYWSEKFEGYMHTKKLRGQLLGTDTSNNDEKYNIRAELVQCLDKTVYHYVEDRMQRKWARSMEAADGTLLLLRDAACDELARATNVSVVEVN